MLRVGRSSNVGENAHRFEQNSRNTQKCDASVEIRTAHPNLLLPNELLPFWAAAPKEPMTYAFTHMGNFLLLLLLLLLRTPPPPSLQAHISAWRPISQPGGPNPSLEAQIPSSRPKSQPQGPDSSHEAQIPREWNLGHGVEDWALRVGFGPQDWDLGLEAGIWASRLRYRPGGRGEGGYEEEGEGGGENFPHV